LRPGKATPYDEDIRVPLLARGPDLPAAQRHRALVGNIDLPATFADIAGLDRPRHFDGRSLLPTMREGSPPFGWREAYLIEHYISKSESYEDYAKEDLPEKESLLDTENLQDSGAYRPAFKGLRTNDSLYVEYNTGERELYDLIKDPYQIENLADSAEKGYIEEFSMWLNRVSSARGKAYFRVEEMPDKLRKSY
jgi:N-acetylglucosamine-6-sulfatase